MSDQQELSELDKLLVHFSNHGGSDLFVTAGRPATMKKDAELINLTEDKLTPEITERLCFQLMNKQQTDEFKETQECNFAYHIAGLARYRVNVYVQRGTPGMVIRAVRTEIPDFESLRLPSILKEALPLIEWVTIIQLPLQDKDPDHQGGNRLHWQTALCCGSLCCEP